MNQTQPPNASPELADVAGGGDAAGDPRRTTIQFRGGRALSALPIVFFIVWAIVQSGVLGVADEAGLVAGMLIALIVGMFFVRGNWANYAQAIFEGMSQKVAVTAIVAWLWAGMFAETLKVGGFVNGLGWLADAAGIGPVLFPAVTFILAGLFATGIGTGYGTTIAFVTLFYPAGVAIGADPVLMFGAILSGAVFGDNLAPVSDTTIVSAVTQDADIGGVVASRFKYAILAAMVAFAFYLIAGAMREGVSVSAEARALFAEEANVVGLIHLLSMGIVIFAALRGRHIVEAISWGLLAAVVFNIVLGLTAPSQMLQFRVPEGSWAAETLASPVSPDGMEPMILAVADDPSVAGSIYSGAAGFFTMSVLILLVLAGAQVMIRGGGFEALERWLIRTVARTVRGAEMTMVLSTVLVNAAITINTAAEIAIAPYIRSIGRRFNINGYRRANILDANTSALGYIFPWSGGVLVGYATMRGLSDQPWFTPTMLVNPVEVWPWVFHGWALVVLFVFAAWTGFGREYVTDRVAKRSTQI